MSNIVNLPKHCMQSIQELQALMGLMNDRLVDCNNNPHVLKRVIDCTNELLKTTERANYSDVDHNLQHEAQLKRVIIQDALFQFKAKLKEVEHVEN